MAALVGNGRSHADATSAQLLPKLLPCPWSAIDARRQAWNIAPARSHSWTALDSISMPTYQMLVPSGPGLGRPGRAMHGPQVTNSHGY